MSNSVSKIVALAVELVNLATTKAAKLTGIAAGHYRQYVNEANAKAQADARIRERNDFAARIRPGYEIVAELLVEAVNNTVDVTHLQTVPSIRKLFNYPWFRKVKGGFFVYVYHARYSKGFGVTADDVRRVLQTEITRLCDIYGHKRLIVYVSFGADGAVVIKVAYAEDVKATQKVTI